MKQFMIGLILIGSFVSNLEAATTVSRDGSSEDCMSCYYQAGRTSKDTASKDTPSQVRGLRSVVGGDESYKDLYKYNSKLNMGPTCSKFASQNGWGVWGKSIMNTLNEEDFPNLMEGTGDLSSVCPAYQSLTTDEKKVIWVAILNTMAIGESTCGMFTTAKGKNGPLAGVVQLHGGSEHKYDPGCNRGDGNNPERTFRCALHMMDSQIRRTDKIFSEKSHWDVLRPQARSQKYKNIQKTVSGLSVCK